MKFLTSIIEHRVKTVPTTGLLKDPFMVVGAIFGGSYGFANSLKNSNGVVWRTSMGMIGGGAIGLATGLFPLHAFGLVFLTDVAYTVSDSYTKRPDEVATDR
jgi:hypothetical protein